MEIQKVLPEDAAALLEIYAPYVRNTAISFEYEVPTVEEFTHRIENYSSRYPYVKAVENESILGYAYASVFKPRKAYDRSVEVSIYVKETERGKGIGKALYAALESSLLEMGILNLNACITSVEGEDPYLTDASQKFHQKSGFSLVGKFHSCGYKFGRWYDMIWMEKQIAPHTENPKEPTFGNWKL